MNISRKKFIKMAASGSVFAIFGGMNIFPRSWRDGGSKCIMVQRQSLVMGSVASFQVIAPSKRDGYEAIRKGIEAFQNMDQIFSMYRGDSEMGHLAAQSGRKPLTLSTDARMVLSKSKQFCEDTNGYFDITIEPLMRRWGFRKDNDTPITPPTDQELKKLERLVGADKLMIENGSGMLKNRGMAIDTGGIVGGYALDKAIYSMKECNIAAAFINFSGDIHCFGECEKGHGWPVQIFNPNTEEPLSQKIELHDEALSTSGAYQNRRMAAAHHSWGHLFQPASGSPIEPVASMTAIHSSAMMADVWSTAAYVGAKPPKEVKTLVIQ